MQSKFHTGNRKMRNTWMFKARVGVCCVFAGPEVRFGRIPAALDDPGDAAIWLQPEVKRTPCFRRLQIHSDISITYVFASLS